MILPPILYYYYYYYYHRRYIAFRPHGYYSTSASTIGFVGDAGLIAVNGDDEWRPLVIGYSSLVSG